MADDGNQLLAELGLASDSGGPGARLRLNLGAGRTAKQLSAVVLRELALEDLISLGTTEAAIKAPPIKELRAQHHAIAKLLANGNKTGEVSAILGIGASRISVLQADPAFQDLLSYYEDLSREEYVRHSADMAAMLHSLGADSIGILHERLVEKPETFSVKELKEIVSMAADRSGFGPTSTVNANVSHSIDEATLARIREGQSGASVAISEDDRQRLLGVAVRATDIHPEAQEAEWSPCEGDGVREESVGDAGREVAGPPSLPSVDQLSGDEGG